MADGTAAGPSAGSGPGGAARRLRRRQADGGDHFPSDRSWGAGGGTGRPNEGEERMTTTWTIERQVPFRNAGLRPGKLVPEGPAPAETPLPPGGVPPVGQLLAPA